MPLELNAHDRALLDGKEGPIGCFAMRVVVRAAEIVGAPRLADVSFAHIDACHYYGTAHLDFVRRFADADARFKIPVWTNTLPVSLRRPESRADAGERFNGEAREVARLYSALGCRPVWTCAPYQIPGGPDFGDQIVGSESNAVAYYNSVVGARTNKYGDFLDVCAAHVGRVPYAGLHTDEGRRGTVEFDVTGLPDDLRQTEMFCHVLGHLVGARAGSRIPVISGLPAGTPKDSLKAISAAVAASGGVAMFHAVGVTPEAPDRTAALHGREPDERITVTPDMVRRARQSLSPASDGPLDMVALGTPHFSVSEFGRLAGLMDGRTVHPDVTVYVSTSRFVEQIAREKGYLEPIAAAGIDVLVDTCTYFSPAIKACRGRVMTNSAKWAYYAPGMLPVDVVFGSLEDCVLSASAGEVRRETASGPGRFWSV
ncbi:aconitase X catalytic domain-containing protein [Nitratireductor sp. XY-223]|uniref:aconitase X n=1 Tax=Nitratireductor sp. XY-223 TaxID=2561926 RepID=UPI0010AADF5A|nr:aconitase X catalytic domain-containing protein [Nitratireductor sp. XY-223]